jgi:hypothetical protein
MKKKRRGESLQSLYIQHWVANADGEQRPGSASHDKRRGGDDESVLSARILISNHY